MTLKFLTLPPRKQTGSAPPVLVILHGYGADEQDLLVLRDVVPPDFLTLSFRAPITLPFGGFAWYHLGQNAQGFVPDDASRLESEALLAEQLTPAICAAGGDPTQVVLAGFSQGAAMTYSLLGKHDLLTEGIMLRGIMALSGYIPTDTTGPLAAKSLHGLPVTITHGEYDDLIPPEALHQAEEILRRAGASVTARLYPCGHGLLPETLSDLKKWSENIIPVLGAQSNP